MRFYHLSTLLALFMLPVCLAAQDLPQPRVISAPADAPPSDAIILFNGTDLSAWQLAEGDGPAAWKIANGYMEVTPGKGSIVTKQNFDNFQLHLEFATPSQVKGDGQGRGNSGVYLMGKYEVQVLDSYQNETYADGGAGAIYKQYPPLVNASRPPGAWQTYDIVFHAPVMNANGSIQTPASVTVLHNGVLVQDHSVMKLKDGSTGSMKTELKPTGPILLQDHKNPVRYRNIWLRSL